MAENANKPFFSSSTYTRQLQSSESPERSSSCLDAILPLHEWFFVAFLSLGQLEGTLTEALRTCISTELFGSTHLEAWNLFCRLCEGNLVRSVGMSCVAWTAGAPGITSGSTSGIYRCTVRYSPPDPKIVCFFRAVDPTSVHLRSSHVQYMWNGLVVWAPRAQDDDDRGGGGAEFDAYHPTSHTWTA